MKNKLLTAEIGFNKYICLQGRIFQKFHDITYSFKFLVLPLSQELFVKLFRLFVSMSMVKRCYKRKYCEQIILCVYI